MERLRCLSAVNRLLPLWLVVFYAPSAASQHVLAYGNTICNGGRLDMSCPAGYAIQLQSAEYGRTALAVCPDAAANLTDCRGPNIADRLRPQCDGKRECYVAVGPHLETTDVCQGTSKYLHVAFNCAAPIYQRLACQDEQLSIECPSSYVIHVTEAMFGRTTASICPNETAEASLNCSEPTALQTAARMCDNQHKCDVNVTTPAFGEPCPGVHKYLSVSFICGECVNHNAQCEHWASNGECVKNPGWMEANCRKACWKCQNDTKLRETICEGKNAKLSCASSNTPNMSLHISDVFFGRRDNSICPHTAIHSNSCGATTVPYERIHALCTGRTNCKVDVYSATMGGDPCPDTYKYMQLAYSCQACENSLGNDTQCEWLAKQWECRHNPQYMHRDCFSACSHCGATACGNKDKSCDYWALIGECNKHMEWMLINCPESCRKCPSDTTTVSPATTTQTPNDDNDLLKNASACEGFSLKILCASGKAISIKSAFYGRHGNETCPHTAMASTDCSDTNALSKLRQTCNAYSSCWVSVLTSKLGEPCPGTYKYANVTYRCIDRSMVQCDLDCGSHGICVGDNTCVCFRGYKGEACKQFSCSEVNECSGHGTCSNPNKCRCDEGWLGDTCNVPSCSGMNHCSKHGRCIGVNRCFCYPFFSGATCSECNTSFQPGGPSCLPCPNCRHGTCVQKTETGTEPVSYIGCFIDKLDDRDFEHVAWDSMPTLSTVKCVLKCYVLGYKFAGLQSGNRCYCGNDYGRHGPTDTCNTKCSGRVEGDVCGGTLATSVWRVTSGYCECDGPNWTGTRCDRCSVGYSGPLCTSDSTASTTTTTSTTTTISMTTTMSTTTKAQTIKPTTAEVIMTTTTSPVSTTKSTTPAVAMTTTMSPEPTTKPTTHAVSMPTTTVTVVTSGQPAAEISTTTTTSTVTTTTDKTRPSTLTPDSTKGAEVPNIGSALMRRKVSLTMTLQMPWKTVYNNRDNPETKEFVGNLTETLTNIYNSSLLPERKVSEVVIKDIRKGSVVVDHDIYLTDPFAGSEEEDVRCHINDFVQNTDTIHGAAASLSQQTEQMCAKRASFCKNGGAFDTHENGTWYCICTPGNTGERCENTRDDVVVTVVIIVIVCTVPLLLILGLCYVIEKKAAKQRKEKAAFIGTSVSYRYQDLSRAQKNSPRRLFKGQSQTENADQDGFEPRQI